MLIWTLSVGWKRQQFPEASCQHSHNRFFSFSEKWKHQAWFCSATQGQIPGNEQTTAVFFPVSQSKTCGAGVNRTSQIHFVWLESIAYFTGISCGPPDMIENGSVQGEEFLFGSEVFYSCDPGFELQGPSRRICHVDKKWSPSAPTCMRK